MAKIRVSRSSLRSLLRAWVTSCFLVMAAASSGAQQGVDVVFLVDTSGIVSDWDTADASRLAVAHGVVDGIRDLGPARVGVLSLAGDASAPAGDWITLPLTELPGDPTARARFLEQTVHSSLSGLGSTEACLPLNVAVEKHLSKMLANRGNPDRPLWLVALTHGEVDPLSPVGDDAWVTQSVRERTEQMTGLPYDEADRPEIKAAAASLLAERFPGQLTTFGENVVLSVVDVNAHPDPARKNQRVQATLNGQTVDLLASLTEQPVVTLDGTNVRTVVEQLLAQAPFPPASNSDGVIIRDLTGAPSQRFRIYQGTSWARVALVADHADFTAQLAYVEGSASPGFFDNHGADRYSRSLFLAQPSAGLIELLVTPNPGAPALNLEAQLTFVLDIDVVAQAPSDGTVLPVGTQLNLDVQLRDNVAGGIITDSELLQGGQIVATWTAAGGEAANDSWAPVGGESHGFSYVHNRATNGSQAFAWTVEASLLKRANSDFDWSREISGEANVEFATPSLAMTFASADDDVDFADGAAGGTLSFGPEWISGDVTSSATLNVTADLHGSGGTVPVTLRFDPSSEYGSASADGSVSAKLTLDGRPLTNGSAVDFSDGAIREIKITVSKSGMPP
ncbi:MAG: hypothetical protein ACI9EF_001001, partial [Pseudohongiellaceae bacterium]